MHILDLHFLNREQTIAAFLLETDEGLVLLETGPHSTFPKLKKEIENLGFHLEDINHVFLTHIHLDHGGAAWVFADLGATIYVHPFGAPHLSKPEKLLESAKRIYQDQMDSLWGEMRPIAKERIQLPKHGEKISIGNTHVIPWFTPGHAVHHIAYQIEDKLIAGDVAGVRINQGIVVPPCPPPDIHIEHWQDSLNLVLRLDLKEIYLTHFGKIMDIESHLNYLEDRLLDWANWIKPYFEKGFDSQSITPLFEKYVATQLADTGINATGILQYEAANPSWMSVAGLMRYWEKEG